MAGQPTSPGVAEAEITDAERHLGVDLPADYLAFLRWSNGWEGFHGHAYLQLSSVSDVRINNDEQFQYAYPGVVAIGGDGGLETFALDYRNGTFSGVVTFDRVAGLESVILLGRTFSEAMARLAVDPSPAGPSGPLTPN